MTQPSPELQGLGHSGGGGRYGGFLRTLTAGSVVQAVSALAGFATIPIIIGHLGAERFGVLVVIISLAPWLTLVDGALYPTMRLLVGESRTRSGYVAPRPLLSAGLRLALKVAAANSVTVLVCLVVLPLVALFGAEGVATRGELVTALACFATPVIVSGPGGIYLGAMEGVGRTVVAALLAGSGPLVALPLTVIVTLLDGGLVELAAAQGLAVAAPRLAAWVYWHHRPSWDEPAEKEAAYRLRLRLVLQMVTISAAVLVQTGLDPLIVSSLLGAEEAATFGIASRLVTGALIPLTVLTPLFAANIAGARAAGWTSASAGAFRRLLAQATGAGLLIGGIVVLLGPPVADLLSGGEVATPLGLYLAGGAFLLVTYASTPLYLAFSGPTGLRWSVRLNVALTVLNVGASVALVRPLGVSGPLWASAGAGLVAILFWLVQWRRNAHLLAESHVASVPATHRGPATT